ncbi:copper resistance protein NlpE [Chryseobacterium arthrosphaerae]|uniref:Copper resistance protein NlpE n=1 Tax=Chryseobacterium arthrosphaerae TaxID=651561 RepID=A0ABU7R6E8_9FLAO|nr:copper resistance protein NlpE N-terminal domain-containing protein [Chryseobacterium arthrosphaerae]
MMKNKMLILGIGAALFLASCTKDKKDGQVGEPADVVADSTATAQPTATDSTHAVTSAQGDTSENALDWNGTYEATVPCADCPGIKTSLTLNNDKTFSITEEYIDRKSKNEDKGSFTWDATGSIITLKGKTANYKYKVGEGMLIQLDMDGKEITGPNKDLYVFKKK